MTKNAKSRKEVRSVLERWGADEQPYKSIVDDALLKLPPHKRRIVQAYYRLPRGERRWRDVAKQEHYSEAHVKGLASVIYDEMSEMLFGKQSYS